jgi:hypothetical protein
MLRGIAVAIAIVGICSGAYAADRVSASEKGSLLVYPKIEIKWQPNGALVQDTFVTLNNDYFSDVHIVMFFVHDTMECEATYHDTTLTGNEAAYWSAATGFPKVVGPFGEGADPMPDECGLMTLRGFIVAFATTAQNEQIRWNHLYGGATVLNYRDGYAWEYNAYAYQVNADNWINGNVVGTPGTIKMDGAEYEPNFDSLLMDFYAVNQFPAIFGSAWRDGIKLDTDLTLVIANWDFRQGGGHYITKADFWIWNENEDSRRAHYCIECWDQRLLSQAGDVFNILFLNTDVGRARIEGVAATECDTIELLSTPEPLLGVAATFGYLGATICDGIWAASGSNLWGSCGSATCDTTAELLYDVTPPPGEKLEQAGSVSDVRAPRTLR